MTSSQSLRVDLAPGEIVVDSDKTANLVREHRRLACALDSLGDLVNAAHEAAEEVSAALRAEPTYDAIPPTVLVDPSWADERPACRSCGQPVEWRDALLMPCSTIEDGDVDSLGIVHRAACESK